MPKLTFLRPIPDFQYSININYDYSNDNKIQAYLPTANSICIINDLVKTATTNIGNKARLLTGAYGKGKSHLTLAIIALMAGKNKTLFTHILNKAKELDGEAYKNINSFIKNKNKFLPVIIDSKDVDLSSSMLNGLKTALVEQNLEHLMPTTFYDKAIETIENWKLGYPETYEKFEKIVSGDVQLFINELLAYNKNYYDRFLEIFPKLTSGTQFNPTLGNDVIKLYDEVNVNLRNLGYKGIFIVYDEFGKFLESCAASDSAMNIELLQKVAERCERTEDQQIHLFLVSHKAIDNYLGKLTKQSIDSWKSISKRFLQIEMESSDDEIYQMTAQVLRKEEAPFATFKDRHREKFKLLNSYLDGQEDIKNIGVFDSIKNKLGDKIVSACYPLHPYTMLILPKISELIAQNERSIFTYLASNEKFTVNYFVKKNSDDFPIIEPDQIYDYFEALFKGEQYNSPIRKQWEITQKAVAQLSLKDNLLAIKMVKTLALIYIINQFDILPPSLNLLQDIYKINYTAADIIAAVSVLEESQLLIKLQFYPYVKVRESSGNNIEEMISNEIAKFESKFKAKDILSKTLANKYIYPMEYNDTFEITRYFEFAFIEFCELREVPNIALLAYEYNADGVVLGILVENETEKKEALEYVATININRIIFVLPNEVISIVSNMKRYEAVKNLMASKSNDTVLIEELDFIAKDLEMLINDYIDTYYLKPELKHCNYFYNGVEEIIQRKRDVTRLLSQICIQIYNHTPRIINENINRNILSSPISKSREKIVDAILMQTKEANLGLSGSLDINLARSLFYVTRIVQDFDNPVFAVENSDENIVYVINKIKEFATLSSDRDRKFSELFDILKSPQYGIGLKDGLIPVFMAIGLLEYKDYLVIKEKKKELPLTTDTILKICNNYNDYSLRIENWDANKTLYLNNMERIFNNYVRNIDKQLSIFEYTVKAVQRWFLQLPKYVKETMFYRNTEGEMLELDKSQKKFKEMLCVAEINAREFLFDKLPNNFGGNYQSVINGVSEYKSIADNSISNHLNYIKTVLVRAMKGNEKQSLASNIEDFYDSLSERTKTYVFENEVGAFMDMLQTSANDENRFLSKLIKNIVSIGINDFSDELMNAIAEKIECVVKRVIDYNENNVDEVMDNKSYKVYYISDNGEEVTKRFDSREQSPKSEMLKDEILGLFDQYGESLNNIEKGQVLLEVLKELTK